MSEKRKSTDSSTSGPPSASKKPAPFWMKGLLTSMEDPELKVFVDEKIVIIKDKYPKAKYHFLVLPKANISSLKNLKKENLELLKHMHKQGEEIAKKSDEHLQFRLGYHAVPSMSQLHLHVISQDFDSPSLKTKRHWNSFTTEYFQESESVMKQLEETGKVEFDRSTFEGLLKKNLRCHVCRKDFTTMPNLKLHIKQHSYKKS